MTAPFRPDPAFDAGSVVVCDWSLSQLRLQDDARFPWLILIPRRAGLYELEDLTIDERAVLIDEIVRAGDLVVVFFAGLSSSNRLMPVPLPFPLPFRLAEHYPRHPPPARVGRAG